MALTTHSRSEQAKAIGWLRRRLSTFLKALEQILNTSNSSLVTLNRPQMVIRRLGIRCTDAQMRIMTISTRQKPDHSKKSRIYAKPMSFSASIGRRLTLPSMETGKAIQSGLRLRSKLSLVNLFGLHMMERFTVEVTIVLRTKQKWEIILEMPSASSYYTIMGVLCRNRSMSNVLLKPRRSILAFLMALLKLNGKLPIQKFID